MWQSLKNIYHLGQSLFVAAVFGFPSRKLKVIGVTGTDGKTTTAHLIYHILKEARRKTALVSSIEAVIDKKTIDTGFHVTTPSPYQVQKLLKQMVDAGCQFAVLEVTSHALDQNRVFAVDFEIAVLTNITLEHIDYHKTFENYQQAKAKLLKRAKIAVLNADDRSFSKLTLLIKSKAVSYGLSTNADVNPVNFPFKISLPGKFNKYNALAAIATCSQLGIDKSVIKSAVANFGGLQGRMEKVDLGQPFSIIVDFAHTPNAFEAALSTLRQVTGGRLIAVFGAAGERDFQKRPEMGKIASQLADLVVLTAEDPRHEDVNKIISQIAQGCKRVGAKAGEDLFMIANRYQAIKFALTKLAKENDTVAILGKGHEKSMAYDDKEHPWSDFRAVKIALARK